MTKTMPLRDDAFARRLRLDQAVKPAFVLRDVPDHHELAIEFVDASIAVGRIDLDRLRVTLDAAVEFDGGVSEESATEMLFEALDDWFGVKEWTEAGWDEPDPWLWESETEDTIEYGVISVCCSADTVRELARQLRWALDPDSLPSSGLTVRHRGES